jgi:endoglucanase
MLDKPRSVDATGYAIRHGKLKLAGVQLSGANGEAVQLMGMSTHGLHWFAPCYSKQSLQYLVENWGTNVYRAALYIGEGGYASQKSLMQSVQDIVQWSEEVGIYVIIDWHVLTPGDPNHWLTGQGAAQANAADFWNEIATLYKGKQHVLYEICNEPNGVSWPLVKSYADSIIATIRAVDPETVILVGTPTWSQDIHLAAADPVAQPYNVMYAFHFYAGTHRSLLGRVRDYASTLPIFVTEWGTSSASGDGGPYLETAKGFLDLFNMQDETGVLISWAQWSYADKAEVSAALKPGSCSRLEWDGVSCSGKFVRSFLQQAMPTVLGARDKQTQVPTVIPSTSSITTGKQTQDLTSTSASLPHSGAAADPTTTTMTTRTSTQKVLVSRRSTTVQPKGTSTIAQALGHVPNVMGATSSKSAGHVVAGRLMLFTSNAAQFVNDHSAHVGVMHATAKIALVPTTSVTARLELMRRRLTSTGRHLQAFGAVNVVFSIDVQGHDEPASTIGERLSNATAAVWTDAVQLSVAIASSVAGASTNYAVSAGTASLEPRAQLLKSVQLEARISPRSRGHRAVLTARIEDAAHKQVLDEALRIWLAQEYGAPEIVSAPIATLIGQSQWGNAVAVPEDDSSSKAWSALFMIAAVVLGSSSLALLYVVARCSKCCSSAAKMQGEECPSKPHKTMVAWTEKVNALTSCTLPRISFAALARARAEAVLATTASRVDAAPVPESSHRCCPATWASVVPGCCYRAYPTTSTTPVEKVHLPADPASPVKPDVSVRASTVQQPYAVRVEVPTSSDRLQCV